MEKALEILKIVSVVVFIVSCVGIIILSQEISLSDKQNYLLVGNQIGFKQNQIQSFNEGAKQGYNFAINEIGKNFTCVQK